LNRLFNVHLGISMKSFSRLVRINKSFQLLNEKSNSLASICEKLGYYDVSHFVKDFKLVCNITPQQYRTNMSDFYNEIAKF
ncbi:helix-turn-helix domain-containing protein, partial [Blautia marasmi]